MIMMTKVKICGIRRREDALLACELGAAMIGMIFYPDSPRYVSEIEARNIVSSLPEDIIPVGVFVNPLFDEIKSVVEKVGIKGIQIHGKANVEDTRKLDLKLIRAHRIDESFRFDTISDEECDYILLDNKVNGLYGGTGSLFDWNLIPSHIDRETLILAGGLNPDNIVDAILRVNPAIVDISSGVESSPGIKDKSELRKLFEAVEVANSGL